jgi:hypothetical protein
VSEGNVPRDGCTWIPYVVTLVHLLLIMSAGYIAVMTVCNWTTADVEFGIFVSSATFGVVGGTVTASRYVVYAVRHREYDRNRILWQLMTPVYSAVLAWIGTLAVRAGMLTLTSAGQQKERLSFVPVFSFFVGLASESFIKRLIASAEALFGERGDLERKTSSRSRSRNVPEGEDRKE